MQLKSVTAQNPCNSPNHPAVEAGSLEIDPNKKELPVQEAYTPRSVCFGCGERISATFSLASLLPKRSRVSSGPAHPEGLHLQSRRRKNGLEAEISIPSKYCAFPGIVNGGIVSTLIDCHGNWFASVDVLMQVSHPCSLQDCRNSSDGQKLPSSASADSGQLYICQWSCCCSLLMSDKCGCIVQVSYKEATPPDTPLVVRSTVGEYHLE